MDLGDGFVVLRCFVWVCLAVVLGLCLVLMVWFWVGFSVGFVLFWVG